ncbi:MAG TPA: sugar O-acetyltransferase [Polyangiaceae bacterium]|nr:sugar O-acetyltransferase [Polyangiaceae bacterium]
MLAGRPYRASDPLLVAERLHARRLVRLFNDAEVDDELGRKRLLDELFGSGGDTATIEPTFRCDYGYNIHVGRAFYANFGCVMLDVVRIEIGDEVLLGPNVQLLTATHPLDAEERAGGLESGAPIHIGHRVWLGAGVIVCPGVSIGDGTTVGAGSVVTKSLPAGSVAVGNPCRVVRTL